MGALATVAAVLFLTALFNLLNDRFLRLQQTIGLMLIALLFTIAVAGLNGLGLTRLYTWQTEFVESVRLDRTLLNGVLCFMLFAGSINVQARLLSEQRRLILSLAFGSTVLAVLLSGAAVWVLLSVFGAGMAFIYALTFGALISTTDPIAALAILGKAGLPPHLEAVISGESLFNDGVGVVIFTICLTVAIGSQDPTAGDALVLFAREVLGGVALGLVAAAVIHRALTRTDVFGTHVLVSLAIVTTAYALSERLHVSGPIATVITGLIAGNYTVPRMAEGTVERFKTFWLAVDETLNATLFVLIGLQLATVAVFLPAYPVSGMSAILACLAARWISIFVPVNLLCRAGAIRARQVGLTNLLTWGGLRGGLAIALALSLPDGPEKDLILHMTYAVVAFSLLVQGLTIDRLFKADQLKTLLAP